MPTKQAPHRLVGCFAAVAFVVFVAVSSLAGPASAQGIGISPVQISMKDALRGGTFVRHTPDHPLPVVTGTSATWYQGKRGFLPPVRIVPEPTTPSRATDSGARA